MYYVIWVSPSEEIKAGMVGKADELVGSSFQQCRRVYVVHSIKNTFVLRPGSFRGLDGGSELAWQARGRLVPFWHENVLPSGVFVVVRIVSGLILVEKATFF